MVGTTSAYPQVIFLIVQTVLLLFRSVVLALTLNIAIEQPSVGFYYLYLFRRQFQTWRILQLENRIAYCTNSIWVEI